ncbi:MAG: hypothetical protein OXF47_07045 [Nitrospira sp.]|nr:hypothetical protein [Nitrospira sp.]
MSKIHYFQRYSSVENTVTNNTLQLFARIYNYSTSRASLLLNELIGEPIEIGIEIEQQRRGKKSVPDGKIIQRSFKIVIESKVDSSSDVPQLLKHLNDFSRENQKVLLLLTKKPIEDEDEIRARFPKQHSGVIFRNVTYEKICEAIKPLFKEYEYEMRDLVEDYVEYCNDMNLFDHSQYLMRIVPCGESFEINKRHGIYFHPSDRGYTRHRFVGLYTNKIVRIIWEIDSVFDVAYNGNKLEKTHIEGEGRKTDEYDDRLVAIIRDAQKECGWDVSSNHRFFCGKPMETNYRKSTPYGIFGPRLVNLQEVIGNFQDASDVAEKLKDGQWE